MKHVFVETNWVVDWAAPAHHRGEAAESLLTRARAGELRLYLPAISLIEAKHPLATKFQPREADPLREYLRWATGAASADLDPLDTAATRRAIDHYERTVKKDLRAIPARLASLRHEACVEVFPLDQEMLMRQVELTSVQLDLGPFDQAILAAVLVRAARLRADGVDATLFAEKDADLQPWKKDHNKPSKPLTRLYDEAHVWVYGDFDLRYPAPYDGWPDDISAAGS